MGDQCNGSGGLRATPTCPESFLMLPRTIIKVMGARVKRVSVLWWTLPDGASCCNVSIFVGQNLRSLAELDGIMATSMDAQRNNGRQGCGCCGRQRDTIDRL